MFSSSCGARCISNKTNALHWWQKASAFPPEHSFAQGFLLTPRFFYSTIELDHSVDEERRRQFVGVVERETWPVCGTRGRARDGRLARLAAVRTLDAVVVEARQDLRLTVVLVAHVTSDFLLHFLESFWEFESFSHAF